MKHAVDLAKKAAGSNATVLLLGESGTGKEIFARAIHNWSERKEQTFYRYQFGGSVERTPGERVVRP